MHLFLTFFWLVIAAGIFLWPDQGPVQLEPAKRVPLGLFTIFLAGYNVMRWWLARLRRRHRAEADPYSRARTARRDEPTNPDFDFSEAPPKSDQQSIQPGPAPAPDERRES